MSTLYLFNRIYYPCLRIYCVLPYGSLLTGVLVGFAILSSAQHSVVAQPTVMSISVEETATSNLSPLKSENAIAPPGNPNSDELNFSNQTEYRGQVLDADGNPAPNSVVSVTYWSPSCGERQTASTTTDENGSFRVLLELLPTEWYSASRISAANSTRTQMAFYRFPEEETNSFNFQIKIQLSPTKTVRLKAVDAKGNPIAGAHAGIQLEQPHTLSGIVTDEAGIAQFDIPQTEQVKAFMAWKDDVGMGYRGRDWQSQLFLGHSSVATEQLDGIDEIVMLRGANRVMVTIVDEDRNPIPGIPVYPTMLEAGGWLNSGTFLHLGNFLECFVEHTDERGVATFAWMPA